MISNDLNPEVTAFFEVKHLGPDCIYNRYVLERTVFEIFDFKSAVTLKTG